jgi:cell division septation protein DedD
VPDLPVDRPPPGEYWVQVEAVSDPAEVMKILEGLTAQGHAGSVDVRSEDGRQVRDLRFGPYATFAQARALADRIRSELGLAVQVTGGPALD